MNNNKIIVNMVRFVFLLVTLSAILLLIVLMMFDYDKICRLLLKSSGKLHKLESFKESYLTIFKFNGIKYFIIILSFLWLALLPYLFKKARFYAEAASNSVKNILILLKGAFLSLEKKEIIIMSLVLIIFTGWRIFDLIVIPISYDEAWTYLNFSSKNILVSASYYPAPNNHVLFSIITVISNILPFDPKINVRIPSLFFTIASFLLVFFMLKKLFNFKAAILASCLFLVSYPVALYSIYARGYALYILFTILCFYSFFEIIFNDSKDVNMYWFLFALSNIFGFYTMPCFLYPALSFCIFGSLLFMLKMDFRNLRKLLFFELIVVMGTLILYSPIFFINGIMSVIGNKYVESKGYDYILYNIIGYWKDSYNWLINAGNSGYILVLCVVIILLFLTAVSEDKNKRVKTLSLMVVFFLLIPFIIIIAQAITPFYRVWSYLIFPMVLAIAVIIKYIFDKFPMAERLTCCICFFIIAYGLFNFEKTYYQDKWHKLDHSAGRLSKYLLDNNLHNFYINNDTEEVIINYEYFVNKKDYLADRLTMDKSKKYDAIILDKDVMEKLPAGYNITYKDDFVKVFELVRGQK